MSKYSAARDLDLTIRTRWYVFASRTDAVIYKDGEDRQFHFVGRLANPLGQRTELELDSDRPGRNTSAAGRTIRHSLDRHCTKHETAARRFADAIARHLDDELRKDRFGELILAAEPHFLGLLREALSSAVREKVSHEIGREYAQGSDSELRAQVLSAIAREGL